MNGCEQIQNSLLIMIYKKCIVYCEVFYRVLKKTVGICSIYKLLHALIYNISSMLY